MLLKLYGIYTQCLKQGDTDLNLLKAVYDSSFSKQVFYFTWTNSTDVILVNIAVNGSGYLGKVFVVHCSKEDPMLLNVLVN